MLLKILKNIFINKNITNHGENKAGHQSFFLKDKINNPTWKIGKFTYGNPIVLDWGEGSTLQIGKFCSIAESVKIFLGGNHRTDWISTYPFNKIEDFQNIAGHITGHPVSKGDVIIGNDVWIGYGALILSGVKIGNGAIIGAYSLVTKDVKPYEIVAGNPAKHIRFRFEKDTIDMLNSSEWWNRDDVQIESLVELLCSNKFQEFQTMLQDLKK